MPKLVRLLGDSEKSTTEVRNSFRQPLIIKPNSKVALVGLSVVLNDDVANEQFLINTQNNAFKIGDADALLTATITTGSYAANALVDEFAIAANYSGTAESASGVHHIAKLVNNKLDLTTHNGVLDDADFNTTVTPEEDLWIVEVGTLSTETATAITASGAVEMHTSYLYSAIPMVHNVFEATLTNPNTKNMAILAYPIDWQFTDPLWGVEVSGGTYYKVIDGVVSTLTTSAAAGDKIVMETFGGTYKLVIRSSADAVKRTEIQENAIARIHYNGRRQIMWQINLDDLGAMTSCKCNILTDAPVGNKHSLQDDHISAGLQFTTLGGGTNGELARFLGFSGVGTSVVTYAGNPAHLEGRDNVSGFASYPGILVTLDGLGPFESFDGAATSRAPDNILYVLNDLKTISANTLQLDIPAPFYLNLNNANPVNVNELRVRFLPAAGQTSNPVLSFSGKPSITLLID
jgi:hypothetical protein